MRLSLCLVLALCLSGAAFAMDGKRRGVGQSGREGGTHTPAMKGSPFFFGAVWGKFLLRLLRTPEAARTSCARPNTPELGGTGCSVNGRYHLVGMWVRAVAHPTPRRPPAPEALMGEKKGRGSALHARPFFYFCRPTPATSGRRARTSTHPCDYVNRLVDRWGSLWACWGR